MGLEVECPDITPPVRLPTPRLARGWTRRKVGRRVPVGTGVFPVGMSEVTLLFPDQGPDKPVDGGRADGVLCQQVEIVSVVERTSRSRP